MSETQVWDQSTCTELTAECTFEVSIYGFQPSLAANAFFLTFFAIAGVTNVVFGIRYRTWSYMVALVLGCLAAAVGYVGRLIMRDNPFADAGFITQICCLIISPAFNSAAIYLTLKHIILCFGEEFSIIKAKWYTYIFIFADILSLLMQGIGGGVASTADDQDQQELGDDLIMAGVSWQVVALFFFAAMAAWYALRRRRALREHPLSTEAAGRLRDTKFRLFVFGVATAWLAIFIRCIYRIIEMAGGWGNSIMRNEALFIVFEGV